MIMDHATVRSLLSAYLDGAVSPAEKNVIEEHLENCADCRRELAELEKTVLRIRGFGEEEPPPWMAQQVMARVREVAEQRRGIFHWLLYPLRVKLPIEAAALVLIAATGYMLYRTAAPQLAQVVPQAPELRGSEAVPQSPALVPGKPAAKSVEKGREKALPGSRREPLQQAEKKGAVPPQLPAAPAPEAPPPSARAERAAPAAVPEERAERSIMMERNSARQVPMHERGASDDLFGAAPRAPESDAGLRKSRSKSLSHAEAPLARLVVEAADRDSAMEEIGAAAGKLGGSIAWKRVTGTGRGLIAVRLDAGRLDELHGRLARIGAVRGKVPPGSEAEGPVEVTIEVVERAE